MWNVTAIDATPVAFGLSQLTTAALGVVLVPYFLNLVSSLLNRSWFSKPVPQELAGIYDDKDYETSQKYNREKSTLGLVSGFVMQVSFIAFWLLGGFPALDNVVVSAGFGPLPTGVIFILALGMGSHFLSIPISVYSTFSLEARYGFNRTTPSTFIKDQLKSLVLMLALGVPLLSALLAFFMFCGTNAWLYAWSTMAVFQLVLFFVAPVLILPLFLEMIPLPEGLAIAVDGIEKESSWIFLKRIFYEIDSGHGGRKAYETRDRQFAGAKKGKKLSLWFSEGKSEWVISEGEPGDGTVYASTGGKSPASPEEASWELQGDGADGEDKEAQDNLLATNASMKLVKHNIGELRKDLLDLAVAVGYTCDKIFIIDGSSRSEHSNAFCTGVGQNRRICLYDTLLAQLTPEEIVAVLGHEIGHDKCHHTKIGMAQALLLGLVEFYLLGQFISNPFLAEAFYMPEAKIYVGFVLFSLIWGTVETFISIPLVMMSRRNEHEADRFSVDANRSYGDLLISGLTKMSRKSKANLTPHPLKVFLEYSHPPLDTRFKHIREYQAKKYGKTR